MTGATRASMNLSTLLAAVENAAPVEAVDTLARQLAEMLDATSVGLLVTNFSGDALVRMSHVSSPHRQVDGGNERIDVVPLAGSVHDRVLTDQQTHVHRTGADWGLIVPVTERGDAIGVLELSLPNNPSADELAYIESAAHALAYVLIASRRHTDLFEWAQRDTPFSLAAEIQRRLLPSAYTMEAGVVTLAGWLEPAANVGGDTFDYSLEREYLYLSITDAMGHSTEAALLATLTVGSLRNTRRRVASPVDMADIANEALREGSRADQFVTGLIARIALRDGTLEIVNAGHPPPFRIRGGCATLLDVPPDPVLGAFSSSYGATHATLEPGDRLVFLTDGFLERNAGIDIEQVLEGSVADHPRQVVRGLAAQVLTATAGNLRDDATVLCVDWHGPGVARDASSGATVQPHQPRQSQP